MVAGKDIISKLVIFITLALILVFVLNKFGIIPFSPFPIITLIAIGGMIFILTKILIFSKDEKRFQFEDALLIAVGLGIIIGYFWFFPDLALDFSTFVVKPTLSVFGGP